MAKAKVTSKWVKDSFGVISFGYCEIQSLLYGVNPSYYTCGVYGWNYDVYLVKDYAVCMGYRGMPKTDVDVVDNYRHIANVYEQKARAIRDNWKISCDDTLKQIEELREQFFAEILK